MKARKVLSDWMKKEMIENGYKGRYYSAPRSIEVENTLPSREETDKIRFIFIGRIEPLKGVEVLLKAVSVLLSRNVRNFSISVYGSGNDDYINELKMKVKLHKSEDPVQQWYIVH